MPTRQGSPRAVALAALLLLAFVLVSRVPGARAAAASESLACEAADGLVAIPARQGTPARNPQAVRAFQMDRHEVTNAEFAAFVRATGYVTHAERAGGGAVFVIPKSLPWGLADPGQWWKFVAGASWRHPYGPGSDLHGRLNEPVVQVTYEDALSYARWKGSDLPTEVEWEHAAYAGRTGPLPSAEWAYADDNEPTANTWQGLFPLINSARDGHAALAPVGCYPPNAYGLYDIIGNVWEWTSTTAGASTDSRIIKGGSYLCSLDYCASFAPAAREAAEQNLPTSHVGFRTVRR